MFSALGAGAYLFITGVIGLDISYQRGMFQGTRWVDGPVWWQIALGGGLLLLGVFFSRRLPSRWTPIPVPRARVIKDVGAGRSPAAARGEQRRSLASGQPKT
jgi:hypothetical protein